MIYAAIYPRKSKQDDRSDSMQAQIEMCQKYIQDKFGTANVRVYDRDYGITGHSIKKRNDFKRMMEDIKAKKINMVVIVRYDRIARNMHDFCNIYHDMEENGCNLVSVSQQIDTSTPYGKNFMYQMAAMAELEWALTSERYKDMHRYKWEHGLAYTGKYPRFGWKIQQTEYGKKLVHDREEETIDIFDHLLLSKSKNETVRYVREMYDPDFTRRMLEAMINSDLFIGKAKTNANFCEPYFTEAYMQSVRSLNQIKKTPSGNHYLFTGLIHCPYCGLKMSVNTMKRKNKAYYYYRCAKSQQKNHPHYAILQDTVEDTLLNRLEGFLSAYFVEVDKISIDKKNAVKRQISDIEDTMKRIDYMFEKGRLTMEEYEKKLADLEADLAEAKRSIPSDQNIMAKDLIVEGWKADYTKLNDKNKQTFWHNILSEIMVDSDKNVTSIRFI